MTHTILLLTNWLLMFNENFERYSEGVSAEVNAAAPVVN